MARTNTNHSSSFYKLDSRFIHQLLLLFFVVVYVQHLNADNIPPGFERIPHQFIAVIGDPESNYGTGAERWGIWRVDPGKSAVWHKLYQEQLVKSEGISPAGWKFDPNDFWLEASGLIMVPPVFPLASGRYVVNGNRAITTVLTVHAPDSQGVQHWNLEDKNSTLHDVTVLSCRPARYTQQDNDVIGSPASLDRSTFPVKREEEMPSVPGCNKQDYTMLFHVGKEIFSSEL